MNSFYKSQKLIIIFIAYIILILIYALVYKWLYNSDKNLFIVQEKIIETIKNETVSNLSKNEKTIDFLLKNQESLDKVFDTTAIIINNYIRNIESTNDYLTFRLKFININRERKIYKYLHRPEKFDFNKKYRTKLVNSNRGTVNENENNIDTTFYFTCNYENFKNQIKLEYHYYPFSFKKDYYNIIVYNNVIGVVFSKNNIPYDRNNYIRNAIITNKSNTLHNSTLSYLIEQNEALKQKVDTQSYFSYWDFVYFSIITITTVGYGDILPNSTMVRMVVSSEILIGILITVFFINGIVTNNISKNKDCNLINKKD